MYENNEKKRRKAEAWEKVMKNFTDDLWIEIFLRLPVRSVIQFKSVSKSWHSIISSHHFAKSHLAKSVKLYDDEIIVGHNALTKDFEDEDGSFSLFHLDSASILMNIRFPYSRGEYPYHLTSVLIGSDCGIVCVCVRLLGWHVAKKNFDIYLWNPTTRQSKLLPSYTIPDNYCTNGVLGFGFDHIDLDFKLVRVVSPTSAEVYSSNMNGWRKIDKPIGYPSSLKFRAFHGFLFAIEYNYTSMTAFNLNKEAFICGIKIPDGNFDDDKSCIEITGFKDSIAAITSIVKEGKIELWTLDDETCLCTGVEASWTKVISLDFGVPFELFPVHFSNSNIILLDHDGERFLYNCNTEAITKVPIHPYLERDELFKYTMSLFSLEGFKRIR